MRRKMADRFWCLGLICCLSTGVTVGCSEDKTVDYNMGSATEHVENSDKSSSLKQFEGASKWDDKWTVENTKESAVTVTVDSKITVPDVDQMSVVEAKEPEFDAAYREKIAKQIFGSGEIYYYDIEHLTKKDLEERQADCKEQYDNYCENDEEGKEELLDEIAVYEELKKSAKDAYTPVDAYQVNEYLGEIDGIFYELSFSESNGIRMYGDGCRTKEICLSVKDLQQVCPDGMSGGDARYTTAEGDPSENNQCRISKEEAKELAEAFLERTWFEYPVFYNGEALLWGDDEPDVYDTKYGYLFTYDAGVDDISFTQFGYQGQYANSVNKKEGENGKYDLYSRMTILITDKGVVEVYAQNPIEITAVSEGTGLLPVEEIEKIMKDRITNAYDDFRFACTSPGEIQFNRMELIYFRIRDKEDTGHFSYIPAWRLYEHQGSLEGISNPVLLNAIDGSVIDFYNEV